MIKLKYLDLGSYNQPSNNERKIEMPLAFWFIENHQDVVEIGEVTPFYREPNHPVYDLSSHIKERKRDLFKVDLSDKNVVSVSTVEHVGFGDYGNSPEPHLAIEAITYIKRKAKNYLITFPIGYNRELENDLVQSGYHYFLMERDNQNNWRMCDHKDMNKFEYNNPHRFGNAICVVSNVLNEIEIEE